MAAFVYDEGMPLSSLPSAQSIAELKRKTLQALAKSAGIKANAKTDVLVHALTELWNEVMAEPEVAPEQKAQGAEEEGENEQVEAHEEAQTTEEEEEEEAQRTEEEEEEEPCAAVDEVPGKGTEEKRRSTRRSASPPTLAVQDKQEEEQAVVEVITVEETAAKPQSARCSGSCTPRPVSGADEAFQKRRSPRLSASDATASTGGAPNNSEATGTKGTSGVLPSEQPTAGKGMQAVSIAGSAGGTARGGWSKAPADRFAKMHEALFSGQKSIRHYSRLQSPAPTSRPRPRLAPGSAKPPAPATPAQLWPGVVPACATGHSAAKAGGGGSTIASKPPTLVIMKSSKKPTTAKPFNLSSTGRKNAEFKPYTGPVRPIKGALALMDKTNAPTAGQQSLAFKGSPPPGSAHKVALPRRQAPKAPLSAQAAQAKTLQQRRKEYAAAGKAKRAAKLGQARQQAATAANRP